MSETGELTAEDRGIKPEAATTKPAQPEISLVAPVQSKEPELSLIAPVESTSETIRTPEKDGWEKSGTHALLLLDRTDIGEGLSKKDKSKLEAIATKEETPKTERADAAAAHVSNKFWEGEDSEYRDKSKEQQWQIWAESMDGFLNKQKGTSQEEFFNKLGVTLDQGGAYAIRDKFFKDGKGNIGEFAKAIVDTNNPDQIKENMESIKELAKLYGKDEKATESVLEHIQALSKVRSDPNKFIESAEQQMSSDESMPGSDVLKWIKENSGQWEEKVDSKKKELAEENKVLKEIHKAKNSAVEDKKRNEAMAKRDQGLPLDPDKDEPQALLAGEIKIADIELKSENNEPMDQVEVFKKVLEKLADDEQAADIKDKIESWVIHESAHFREAQKYYKNVNFIINLSKDNDGKFIVHPETQYTDFKDETLSEEEQMKIIGQVMVAPGLGRDGNDLAGMSKHDMNSVQLYEYEKNEDGKIKESPDGELIGHPTGAVSEARDYMNNPDNQEAIDAYINEHHEGTLTEEVKDQIIRNVNLRVALKKQNNPQWEIDLTNLS